MKKEQSTVEFISTVDAAKKSSVTKPTIISWCKNYKIGKKIGGRWRVYRDKLEKLLSGE